MPRPLPAPACSCRQLGLGVGMQHPEMGLTVLACLTIVYSLTLTFTGVAVMPVHTLCSLFGALLVPCSSNFDPPFDGFPEISERGKITHCTHPTCHCQPTRTSIALRLDVGSLMIVFCVAIQSGAQMLFLFLSCIRRRA